MEHIEIKSLTLEELQGVVNLYPWYALGRKELCRRLYEMGGDAIGAAQLRDAALYVPSRAKIAELLSRSKGSDCSDKDLEKLLRSYMEEDKKAPAAASRPRGGDYFSGEEYDSVRKAEDNVFSRFAAAATSPREKGDGFDMQAFCTETLAQIYLEQGYYEQAKQIYSHLLLKFPEKSAYFAALIEKLDLAISEN